jgi:hypothetical protein
MQRENSGFRTDTIEYILQVTVKKCIGIINKKSSITSVRDDSYAGFRTATSYILTKMHQNENMYSSKIFHAYPAGAENRLKDDREL